jgi:hypothetical protein
MAGTTLLGEIVTAEMEKALTRVGIKEAIAQVTAKKNESAFISLKRRFAGNEVATMALPSVAGNRFGSLPAWTMPTLAWQAVIRKTKVSRKFNGVHWL